jgi:hypothetical protein
MENTAARAEYRKLAKIVFPRMAEIQRRLNTKTYHCDWCATSITLSDDTFWCQNDNCHKVVCGREGCSNNLCYYVCCDECEDIAQST